MTNKPTRNTHPTSSLTTYSEKHSIKESKQQVQTHLTRRNQSTNHQHQRRTHTATRFNQPPNPKPKQVNLIDPYKPATSNPQFSRLHRKQLQANQRCKPYKTHATTHPASQIPQHPNTKSSHSKRNQTKPITNNKTRQNPQTAYNYTTEKQQNYSIHKQPSTKAPKHSLEIQ